MEDVKKRKDKKNKEPEVAPVEETFQEPVKSETAPDRVIREYAGIQIDVTPAQKVVSGRRYSFTQWAVRRGKKPQHQPGMKAYVKNPDKPRTIEEWDKLFLTY